LAIINGAGLCSTALERVSQFFFGFFSVCQIVNDGDKQPSFTQQCFADG